MNYIYSKNEKFVCNINIYDLLQVVDSNKKIYNVSGIDSYIENWKKALYNCFQDEKNQTHHLQSSHYFWESIFVNGAEMRFHFNIDKAKQISSSYQSQIIPLETFSEYFDDFSKATIKFSNPNIIKCNYDYSICQEPIFIVNFCHCGSLYLVIDGNHRVSARKKSNIHYINGILFTPQDSLKLLSSEFEKAIYLLLYEGFLLAQNELGVIKNSNAKLYL